MSGPRMAQPPQFDKPRVHLDTDVTYLKGVGPARAEALRRLGILTARDLLSMKVIDEVIPEPAGGAHRDYKKAAENLGKALRKHLGALRALKGDALVEDRYRKFRALGVFSGR